MLALSGWLLLAFLPSWRFGTDAIAGVAIPVILAFLYGWLLVTHASDGQGGFSSLAEVGLLFSNEFLLLAGWIHYLAFDLFIGSWEVRDAQRNGIHHGMVIPCLLLTFLAGPIGLLLYLSIRAGMKNRWILNDA